MVFLNRHPIKSGDRVKAVDGTEYELPFANEFACFGSRQVPPWCPDHLATWRMESDQLLLHFCDACKARHCSKNMPFTGETWTKLPPRLDGA